MSLTPWYKVATPREDLRKRKPLDAAQFAVHLDRVAAGDAPPEYADPERFLARTYITDGLKRFVGEVLRRLSSEREGSNAVLNLVTGFGGGKTHALTLLYHLGRSGHAANDLPGVRTLLDASRLDSVPAAAVAVFVGTEWDALQGKAGKGEPHRLTPWGEIAWQLAQQAGDPSLFDAVAEQDKARVRPGKSNIRKFLPVDRPVLILMDEVMNFVTAARGIAVEKSTLASQFYEFVHNLTDEADSHDNLCVVVSLPKSEEEMSAEDEGDFRRLAKVTTRVAEPYVLAKDLEIPEIVRRRLFDDPGADAQIKATAKAFARWLTEHRDQVPEWFPVDNAEEIFRATYPFHPTVLSVFERKWQALPSFQRTRGILRLLAQWVSITYEAGFKGAHEEPLIALGTAPLDDQFFRAAVLDQLGGEALQAAIVSDIAGEQSNAERLDVTAEDTLRAARIHRKVATAIFFESSGGQVKDRATLREVRLAVGEPGLEIGNVETAVDALRDACYFLTAEGSEYRFSTKPNLNKLVADRRAALDTTDVEEHGRATIGRVFSATKGTEFPFDVVPFPQDSAEIADTPSLHLVVLGPDQVWGESVKELVEHWMGEHGGSARRFRNALVWSAADDSAGLLNAARRDRAWQCLAEEADAREFDEAQRKELEQNRIRAARDLEEAVWRSYRWLAYLAQDGSLAEEDLGVVHSSAAPSMQAFIQARLRQKDELTEALAPNRVVQNWPAVVGGTKPEWSTKALRDAVYASPAFTRLLDSAALKETVSKGVQQGLFGYAARGESGYVRVVFKDALSPDEVEYSDDVELMLPERAQALVSAEPSAEKPVAPEVEPVGEPVVSTAGGEQARIFTEEKVAALRWEGEVPWQKWTTFYNKVLSNLVSGEVTVTVRVESRPSGGLPKNRADAVRDNLVELGLSGEVSTEEQNAEEDDT
jgi:hypothetical protein